MDSTIETISPGLVSTMSVYIPNSDLDVTNSYSLFVHGHYRDAYECQKKFVEYLKKTSSQLSYDCEYHNLLVYKIKIGFYKEAKDEFYELMTKYASIYDKEIQNNQNVEELGGQKSQNDDFIRMQKLYRSCFMHYICLLMKFDQPEQMKDLCDEYFAKFSQLDDITFQIKLVYFYTFDERPINYVEENIKQIKEHYPNNEEYLMRPYMQMIERLITLKKQNEAEEYFSLIKNFLNNNQIPNCSFKTTVWKSEAWMEFGKGQREKAMELMKQSIKFFHTLNDHHPELNDLYYQIGLMLGQMNKNKECRKYMDLALKLDNMLHGKSTRFMIDLILGTIEFKENNTKKCIRYIYQAIKKININKKSSANVLQLTHFYLMRCFSKLDDKKNGLNASLLQLKLQKTQNSDTGTQYIIANSMLKEYNATSIEGSLKDV